MSVNDYAEKVVKEFITNITDYVFLAIEHDDEAMREYIRKVDEFGLTAVNTAIGKKVKEILNLDNCGRNEKPQSRIILSYETHKVK